MIELAAVRELVKDYGLAVLFPNAVVEDPIVTIISAWCAKQGLMNVFAVYIVRLVAAAANARNVGNWKSQLSVPAL